MRGPVCDSTGFKVVPNPKIVSDSGSIEQDQEIAHQSLRLSEMLPVLALNSVARRSYSFAFC